MSEASDRSEPEQLPEVSPQAINQLADQVRALTKDLELRASEFKLRQRELELGDEQNKRAAQFAEKSLAAEVENAREVRTFTLGLSSLLWTRATLVALAFFGLLAYTASVGGGEVAKEIIKAVLYIVPSLIGAGGAGYALGRKKEREAVQEEERRGLPG